MSNLLDISWFFELTCLVAIYGSQAGLILDIFGAGLLFAYARPIQIEAEISCSLMERLTLEAEGGEWIHTVPFAEHKQQVKRLRKRVNRNRRCGSLGLAMLAAGFSLQSIGTSG